MSDQFDFAAMMDSMKSVATINRICYMAHIEAGFSPRESLNLTAEAMKTIINTMLGLQGSQAMQPPQ